MSKHRKSDTTKREPLEPSSAEVARPGEPDRPPARLSGRLAGFAVDITATDFDEYDEGDGLAEVRLGPPPKDSFVRVERDPIARVHLIVQHVEGEFGKTRSLVTPEIAEVLPDDAKLFDLFRWVDRDGREGIWPVPLSGGSHRRAELTAIAKAATSWHRIIWRTAGKSGARAALPAANGAAFGNPKWSPRTGEHLVEIAFRERMISDVDHPLVQALLGMD
jgi:hypothetical protein